MYNNKRPGGFNSSFRGNSYSYRDRSNSGGRNRSFNRPSNNGNSSNSGVSSNSTGFAQRGTSYNKRPFSSRRPYRSNSSYNSPPTQVETSSYQSARGPYIANRSSSYSNGPRRYGNPGGGSRFGLARGRTKTSLGKDPNIFIKKAQQITPELEFKPHNSFVDFDIANPIKENIIKKGYMIPTPIQDQAIDPILKGRDLIGLANTGTGKTAAFLIPIIDKIFKNRDQKALIIVPTRELAAQINQELKSLAWDMRIYSTIVIGGANVHRQIFEIKRNPHVVIGTPGRLKDLIEQKVLRLEEFSTFVLDEVDLMVDIGFIHDVKYFISLLPKVRQSLFFSATISPKVKEILNAFVTDAVTVSVKKQDTSENVDQDVVKIVDKSKKVDQLHDLLIKDGFDKVLIFGRTKHGIEKLNKELIFRGFKVGAIHGNKKQGHRQKTLESFKRNDIKILLATDVAARGLDIDSVTHVINYEIPDTFDEYIHRIGRTGRAGKKGTALTFID